MGPFYVLTLLLLSVRAEGRAFDPCHCEDLDEPDVQTSDDFPNNKPDIDPLTPVNSGTQSSLNKKTENSIGPRYSDDEISKGDGNYNDGRNDASVRRLEREVTKEDSGSSANKSASPEVANLETSNPVASPTGEIAGAKTEKPEIPSEMNATNVKPTGIANLETSNPIASPTGEIAGTKTEKHKSPSEMNATNVKNTGIDVANLETSNPIASPTGEISGAKTEKPSETNAANDKSTGIDKEVPKTPNANLPRDGSTSTTEPSTRNIPSTTDPSARTSPSTTDPSTRNNSSITDSSARNSPSTIGPSARKASAGNENLEPTSTLKAESSTTKAESSTTKPESSTAKAESSTTKAESSTRPQCEAHYTWDDKFQQCFFDPQNVPMANSDEYGNIEANAGVTTEPAPTTTVVHDCPENEKWDELLQDCYFEPHLKPPAIMDYYGDMFANAG